MAEIDIPKYPTLAAVDRELEARQSKSTRTYLGMSQIGHPCARNLWYSFRWVAGRHISAKGLKAIQDGFAGEDVMASRLRMVPGVTLKTVDDQGQQFGFTSIHGHFKGHMDGAVIGLLEAPKTWHVWEHKQVNPTKFKALSSAVDKNGEKSALKYWDEVYHAQAICYMALSGMERHFLTVSSPGGRDYMSVRTEADSQEAKRLLDRAEKVIYADEPLPRISNDPAWYQCKFCDFRNVCHGTQIPQPNCRTCAHVTVGRDNAEWYCERHHKQLSTQDQRNGCQSHRFIPVLLENVASMTDASQEGNWVRYKRRSDGVEFTNGQPPTGLSSEEIAS